MRGFIVSLLLSLAVLRLDIVTAQELCQTYVERNRLTITSALLTELQQSGSSLNEVVECLSENGRIEFDVRRLRVDSTIVIDRALNITSIGNTETTLLCDGVPIFDIQANVEISRLQIRECQLESEEAPIVVRSDAELSLTAIDFVENRNSVGSAAILAESGSRLTVIDAQFRRNNGKTASAIRVEARSRVGLNGCEFAANRGVGSVVSLRDVRRVDIVATIFRDNVVESTNRGGVIRIRSENGTRLTIEGDSAFLQNRAVGSDGGALYLQGEIHLRILDETRFVGNSAAGRGGAIYSTATGKITIQGSFFTDNDSNFTGGGAMFVTNSGASGVEMQISRSVFARNAALNYLGSGGALRLQGGGVNCTLSDSVTFVLNTAELNGGGMYISNGAEAHIANASFVGNEALSGGAGALYIVSLQKRRSTTMEVEVERSSFLFNRALYTTRGGGTVGVVGFGAQLTIRNCEFSDNDGGLGSGGALYLYSGPVVNISESQFRRNKATWGAALYAENDAQYIVYDSQFLQNSAAEGGAIHVRGDVDVHVERTKFRENSAITEGGAIKMRNYKSGGDELAELRIESCDFVENVAGSNLFEDALYGTVTRGGALHTVGSGIIAEIYRSDFRRNRASEGGALHINAVADCNIVENRVINNRGNFGGGIYVAIDEKVVPSKYPFYFINNGEMRNNTADSSGGAVFVGTSTSVTDESALNARIFILKMQENSYIDNKASTSGGAVSMTGAGVQITTSRFASNQAMEQGGATEATRGGALIVQNGAVLECRQTAFELNTATIGGAVSIIDASMECSEVGFSRNYVSDGGVGGGVGIELSAGKDIPVLNSGNRLRNIVFECGTCRFERNNGSRLGGALFLHDESMPGGVPFESDCTREEQFQVVTEDDALTCPTYFRYLDRLDGRVVRFQATTFERNAARAGGAIFTDNPAIVNITAELTESDGVRMNEAFLLRRESDFESAEVAFIDNRNFDGGYGSDFATPPVQALLKREDDESGPARHRLVYDDFQSGQRLKIVITFRDQLNEVVTVGSDVEAVLQYSPTNAEGKDLEVSGQLTAKMSDTGSVEFSGTRLRGASDTSYRLSVQFRSTSDLQTLYLNDSVIEVTVRPCKIGEFTRQDDYLIECERCASGTFAPDPSAPSCTDCSSIEHGSCFGDSIVPDRLYWHATSFSSKMFRCVGHESCSFKNRTELVRGTAKNGHDAGDPVLYTGSSSTLCHTGYEGPLCGTCSAGYGRSGFMCQKCASAGVRTFVLLLIILWSFGFLSYFIRSVLQLASRIEFNKRFNRAPTELQQRFMETIPSRPPEEQLPSEEPSFRTYVSRAEIVPDTPQLSASSSMVHMNPSNRRIQPHNGVQLQATPSRADLARALANQIHTSRLNSLRPRGMKEDKESSQLGSPVSMKKSARLRGRLVGKLHSLVNSKSEQEVEPLTLANPVSEILKILVNFLQVTSVAVSINVDWTQPLRRTLSIMGSLGSVTSSSEYMSLDCFMSDSDEWRSLRRMTIAILYPLLLFMVYVLLWSIYTFIKKFSKNYLTQRIWLTYLAINYFIYIGMTRNLLRFFACVRISDEEHIGIDEEIVWEEDTSIQCFSRRHAALVGVFVVPLLIVVTFGFPIGTFVILWRNKDRLEDENFVATYGFLYRAYDQHYWEVVVLLRKGLVATAAVFSYVLGENLQGLLCILVVVIALSLHLTFQPFTQEIPQLNYLETFSLSTTVVVFVAGLMMNDPKTTYGGRVLLSIVAILFVCSAVCTMLFELLIASEEVVDMKLIELELMEISDVIDARLSRKIEVCFLHYWRLFQNGILLIIRHLKSRIFPTKPSPPPVQGSLQMTVFRSESQIWYR